MKKFLPFLIVSTIMLAVPASADEGITVYSNGNLVKDKGVIVDGRTMVPVRGVFEYMGYTVDWDDSTKTATLTNTKKETTITVTKDEEVFYVNGEAFTPEVPQQIVDGRFMLPLRAVGEAVNAKVGWIEEKKTATINERNQFIKINEVAEDDPSIADMPVNEIN